MTPDQIAIESLAVLHLQTWITGLAIFLGPLSGVLFTLWSQGRKERRDAKTRLFSILLANRKGVVTPDVSRALNSIDIVFTENKNVRELWRQYYVLLAQPVREERGHVWLQLLGAMAVVLGYRDLSTVELDRFYIPQGHVEDSQFQQRMGQHWERVLTNTEHFVVGVRAEGAAAKFDEAAVSKAQATPVGGTPKA